MSFCRLPFSPLFSASFTFPLSSAFFRHLPLPSTFSFFHLPFSLYFKFLRLFPLLLPSLIIPVLKSGSNAMSSPPLPSHMVVKGHQSEREGAKHLPKTTLLKIPHASEIVSGLPRSSPYCLLNYLDFDGKDISLLSVLAIALGILDMVFDADILRRLDEGIPISTSWELIGANKYTRRAVNDEQRTVCNKSILANPLWRSYFGTLQMSTVGRLPWWVPSESRSSSLNSLFKTFWRPRSSGARTCSRCGVCERECSVKSSARCENVW
jgi:hypothetical protein